MTGRPARPWVVLADFLLAGSLLVGVLLGGWVHAEVIAVQAAPAVWLAAEADGVVALLSDGTAVRVRNFGKAVIARGWTSEELWVCGGEVYGVNGRGRIARASGRTGPAVAQYSTPACLPSGDLVALDAEARSVMRLTPTLEVRSTAEVDALADTIILYTPFGDGDEGVLALLAEPTLRYRHGVLGDEVEAAALVVLSASNLAAVASYRFAAPAAIEQRGVVPWSVGDRQGFYITRSTPREGAGVVALELTSTDRGTFLQPAAAAPPIGTPNRWLNLFAASGDAAFAVRTPHIGGPFERYRLDPPTLSVERFDLGVTNHLLGSRNIDLGVLMPTRGPDTWLVLPVQDLHALRVIRCADACRVAASLPLSGRLTSNVVVGGLADGTMVLYAADDGGAIHRFSLEMVETPF